MLIRLSDTMGATIIRPFRTFFDIPPSPLSLFLKELNLILTGMMNATNQLNEIKTPNSTPTPVFLFIKLDNIIGLEVLNSSRMLWILYVDRLYMKYNDSCSYFWSLRIGMFQVKDQKNYFVPCSTFQNKNVMLRCFFKKRFIFV